MNRYNAQKNNILKYRSPRRKRGFVSLVFTSNSIKKVGLALSLCSLLFLMTFGIISLPALNKIGVASTVVFARNNELEKLKTDAMWLFSIASPFFTKKQIQPESEQKEIVQLETNIKKETNKSNGLELKNETEYDINPQLLVKEKPKLKTNTPKVLIVHTHGSESYTQSEKYQYTPSGNYRTQDTKFNVIKVGEKLAESLRVHGVEVIHDKSINDFPSYNDSYNKTEKIIKSHLEADSDIAFVFDIHRDAVGDGDNIVKFVADVNGKTAAQVMIVCGTDTNLKHPHWEKNLLLALHIQNHIEERCPDLMRPLNIRKERFNMHLSEGSLLFEVGTNGNTMEEALRSAEILGNTIGEFINGLK